MNDRELYRRGLRTAFAAWEVYAAGTAEASVRHERGYSAAVFPRGPEAHVGTHEHARRRGLATALTARLVDEAIGRGCSTATLQSTPMAERIDTSCGFRAVARILELVPG